jgi:hypothetical protein
MRVLALLIFGIYIIPFAHAQQPPSTEIQSVQRDSKAISVLAQVLTAAGGIPSFASIRDFSATGKITYFERGDVEAGDVMLRGRGTSEFRLDATLPSGPRSLVVQDGRHASKLETDGKLTTMPIHNAVTVGALSLPYLEILEALNEPSTSITTMEGIEIDGQIVSQIRVQRHFSPKLDPAGALTRATFKDFLIDPSTHMILGTSDVIHPVRTLTENLPHQIRYADYRSVNGVQMPFAITETIAWGKTWTIRLDSISFNSGLSKSDFKF